jgi:hypothetical protein
MANEKKYKFVAKVNLKGDYDIDDGLGEAMQEVAAGTVAITGDKKLYDSLVEQGYAKPFKKGADEEAEEVPLAADSAKGPKVETNRDAGGKTK